MAGLSFPVAVWRKFSDDQAGNLAALISYYAFLAIFPLLLILFTVLNVVLHDHKTWPHLRRPNRTSGPTSCTRRPRTGRARPSTWT